MQNGSQRVTTNFVFNFKVLRLRVGAQIVDLTGDARLEFLCLKCVRGSIGYQPTNRGRAKRAQLRAAPITISGITITWHCSSEPNKFTSTSGNS